MQTDITKIDKIMKNLGYILIIGGFTLLAYISYLLFYTPKYFETSQPFKLSKKEYKIGETLVYTSDYCKYKEYVPLSISKSLVDGFIYPLPTPSNTVTAFPIGCRVIDVYVPLILPDTTPVNKKYHIEIAIDYKINILQSQTRTFRTEDFTLIKK